MAAAGPTLVEVPLAWLFFAQHSAESEQPDQALFHPAWDAK